MTSATDRDVIAGLAELPEPSVNGGGRRGPAHGSVPTAASADADEAAAREARRLYDDRGIDAVAPDDAIARYLATNELVLAQHPRAVLNAERDVPGYIGALYLTSERILHLGSVVVSVHLRDIAESALAGERLLFTLRNGDGITIDLPAPRLFRTQVAAAAYATRG